MFPIIHQSFRKVELMVSGFKFDFRFSGLIATAFCMGVSFLFLGCAVSPDISLVPASLKERQMQTRVYDMSDEISLLSAGVGVLQDMGFSIDESETSVGVVTASKVMDANYLGQVATSIGVYLLSRGKAKVKQDKKQKIRVNLVTFPYQRRKDKFSVRVTFQRVIWDTDDKISKVQNLTEPVMYQKFFASLSKSVFLEGHEI